MNRNDKEATEEHAEAALVRLMLTLCLSGADWTLDTCRGSLCFLKYAANNHHGNKCSCGFIHFARGDPVLLKDFFLLLRLCSDYVSHC